MNDIATSLSGSTAGFNVISNGPSGVNPALPGDAILGSFTADATTQTFDIAGSTNGGASANSGGRAQINAFQLRTIPAAIPEPSSLAVLALGSLVFAGRRRR